MSKKEKDISKELRALELPICVDMLVEVFLGMDDELQADFFVKCAEMAKAWPSDQRQQWYSVGLHLKTCECSSDEAREMIKALHNGLRDD